MKKVIVLTILVFMIFFKNFATANYNKLIYDFKINSITGEVINFSDYEKEQLTNRNNWPIILPRYPSSSSFKGSLQKYNTVKRDILKDIPKDPKIKEERLQKLRERMRKRK